MKKRLALLGILLATGSSGARQKEPGQEKIVSQRGRELQGMPRVWYAVASMEPGTSAQEMRSNALSYFQTINRYSDHVKGTYTVALFSDHNGGNRLFGRLRGDQSRPTLTPFHPGDGSYLSQAYMVLGLEYVDRMPYLQGTVQQHNVPSQFLEVWQRCSPRDLKDAEQELYRVATTARLIYGDQPLTGVIVHLYAYDQQTHILSAAFSANGRFDQDLQSPPSDRPWQLSPTKAKPWPARR